MMGIASKAITLLNKKPIAIQGKTQNKYFSFFQPFIVNNSAARMAAITDESRRASRANPQKGPENKSVKKPIAAAI